MTGGTSGTGLATAEEFLKAGASVVITGRDPSTLRSARSQLGELAAADQLVAVRADVTVAGHLDHVMDEIRGQFGRLGISPQSETSLRRGDRYSARGATF